MALDKLVIKDDALRKAHSSLVAAKLDFDQVQDRADDAADACGHAGLAKALRDSAGNWRLHRDKISENLETLAQLMKSTLDGFDTWDIQTRDALTDTGSDAGTGSGPSAVTVEEEPRQGRSAAPGATGSAPLVGGQPLPQVVDTQGGDRPQPAPVPPVSGTAEVAPVGTPGGQDGARDAAAGPSPLPPTPWQRRELGDAGLEDLARALVQRWQQLGGSEKAIIAALVAAGIAGAGKLGGWGTGGPASGGGGSSAAPSAAESDAGATLTTGGFTAPERADAVSDGAVVAAEGEADAEAREASGADAAEPEQQTGELGLQQDEPAPPADDLPAGGLPTGGPASELAASDLADLPPAPSGGKPLPEPLPPLAAALGASAEAGADSGAASEPLPSLAGAGPSVEPSPSAELPSLAGEPSASLAMAGGAALPALQTAGGLRATPAASATAVTGGVGGTGALPNLAGTGGVSGSEPRRADEARPATDPKRILADLRGDEGWEES